MENKISDRLRFVLSQTDNPKLIELSGKIASLDIKIQESLLDCIEQKIPLELVLLALTKSEEVKQEAMQSEARHSSQA
jgi:hypothetical protein